jgi:hypothetical protein
VAQITETWHEPMILWQALVGGPSSGKTPALEALRRALGGVEKTAGREKRGPVVIDHDMPFARLLAAANRQPAGALLWRDEPAAWLAALGCNGRGEARALSPLLDTWSPLRTALGPGSPALSIIGCLDPARLDGALRDWRSATSTAISAACTARCSAARAPRPRGSARDAAWSCGWRWRSRCSTGR